MDIKRWINLFAILKPGIYSKENTVELMIGQDITFHKNIQQIN